MRNRPLQHALATLGASLVLGCAPGPVAGQPVGPAQNRGPASTAASTLGPNAPSAAASVSAAAASVSAAAASVAGAAGISASPASASPNDTVAGNPGDTGAGADVIFPFQYEALRVEGGGSLRMQSLEGQPVMVHFWASWCRPCVAEMPQLAALHARYAGAGLRLVTVSVDESAAAMRAFLQRTQVPGMLLHDPSNEAGLTFGVNNLPATFIYDRRGRLRYSTEHMMNAQDPVIHRALNAAVAP